ncbi:HIT domain-containing protein [Streptomyces sp. MS2A]|nr:HIT domain-containing protein [Streptomyces sp. MS2A]
MPTNEHSSLVGSTATSYVRLARNQEHAGYCLVILRDHVTDMVDLSPTQLACFWADVQRAGQAIGDVFQPKKVDYLVMGHRMPHLHCHLLPQHANDDPHRNVDISDGPTFLPTDVFDRSVSMLAHAWDLSAPTG